MMFSKGEPSLFLVQQFMQSLGSARTSPAKVLDIKDGHEALDRCLFSTEEHTRDGWSRSATASPTSSVFGVCLNVCPCQVQTGLQACMLW